MEDAVVVVVFVIAVGALLLLAVYTISPFLSAKIVEVPTAPSANLPERRVYVYFDSRALTAVEFDGDVEWFKTTLGINGSLVAMFYIYPGGYRCELMRGGISVRLGEDPYAGLWCPPPFKNISLAGCIPAGITSRGRWLLLQYKCP